MFKTQLSRGMYILLRVINGASLPRLGTIPESEHIHHWEDAPFHAALQLVQQMVKVI